LPPVSDWTPILTAKKCASGDPVRRAKLPTQIVILTMAGEAPFPRRLLEAGASGYLTKGCPAEELVKAIRTVEDGLQDSLVQLRNIHDRPGPNERPCPDMGPLILKHSPSWHQQRA